MNKIAVVGQGYVGLPLAVAFARHFPVIGYDTNIKRVQEIQSGYDRTQEVSKETLVGVMRISDDTAHEKGYIITSDSERIALANIYIITVPTPIDQFNAPDLSYLLAASKTVGEVLKKGDTVIYESTVYPGCTEEDCIPVLEKYSGLKLNKDFYVGYSPERINPGDKIHTLENVVKVTSGSTPEAAVFIDNLYRVIIKAGTYKAESIRVAEAAKVIENAQRDLNISFVNELALIFDKMGLETSEVLNAAATKYNFLKYKPGLVGGHCISVDPYYLTYKATKLGYVPEVILSGRRVNNKMGAFVASKTIKLMLQKGISVKGAKILILGFSFKENCPDVRNTSVINIYKELLEYETQPAICDPWVDKKEVEDYYGVHLLDIERIYEDKYDAIIAAVAHDCFKDLELQKLQSDNCVIFDCKSIWNKEVSDTRL